MTQATKMAGKWMAMALLASSTLGMGTGCAIHSQAPIKEVAYDFSDADFYDRAYAPSPDYGPEKVVGGEAPSAPSTVIIVGPTPRAAAPAPAGNVVGAALTD